MMAYYFSCTLCNSTFHPPQWLENTFLSHLTTWKDSVNACSEIPEDCKQKVLLSARTMEGIEISGIKFNGNDETFSLFTDIEKIVRYLLPKHVIGSTHSQTLDELVKEVACNEDVQFILSQDIDSEEESQELLFEVVHLWVRICNCINMDGDIQICQQRN